MPFGSKTDSPVRDNQALQCRRKISSSAVLRSVESLQSGILPLAKRQEE